MIPALIAAAASLYASEQQKKAAKDSQNALEGLGKDINAVQAPSLQDQQIQLALQKYLGDYDPAQEIAQQLAGNYYSQVQTDPNKIADQENYLNTLKQVAQQGMTPEEEAQRNALMRKVEAQSQSKLQDIEREQAQKGMSSSGATLLSKLMAQQQAQSNAAIDSDKLASEMFQRKLQAGAGASDLAKQLEQQQYQRAMDMGGKRQSIDEFNTNLSSQSQARNVSAKNQAGLAGWTEKQNIANQNTALANEQQKYNTELLRQRYLDQLSKVQMAHGQTPNIANSIANQGKINAEQTDAIGQLIGSGADKYFSQKKQSKQKDDESLSSILRKKNLQP